MIHGQKRVFVIEALQRKEKKNGWRLYRWKEETKREGIGRGKEEKQTNKRKTLNCKHVKL